MNQQLRMSLSYIEGNLSTVISYKSPPDKDCMESGTAIRYRGPIHGTADSFIPVYVHYKLEDVLSMDTKNIHRTGVKTVGMEQTYNLNRLLQLECATRMPCEFAMDGTDYTFYGFGTVHFGYYVDGEIVGYRSMEIEDGILKLWTSYVLPEHRGKGIYSRLLDAAILYARQNNVDTIVVSTDSSEGNKMHGILKHRGFQPHELSMRNYFNTPCPR